MRQANITEVSIDKVRDDAEALSSNAPPLSLSGTLLGCAALGNLLHVSTQNIPPDKSPSS